MAPQDSKIAVEI